jgi:hypothetical protein
MLKQSKRDRALYLRAYAATKNRIFGDELRALAWELENEAVADERKTFSQSGHQQHS